jgi:putative intracellular protease/amidase
MYKAINVHNPEKPKRVLILASNPAVSEQTGWPIGFWWAELTHPYWEFGEHGYQVAVASPGGGPLEADKWSDPRDESGYSADDSPASSNTRGLQPPACSSRRSVSELRSSCGDNVDTTSISHDVTRGSR